MRSLVFVSRCRKSVTITHCHSFVQIKCHTIRYVHVDFFLFIFLSFFPHFACWTNTDHHYFSLKLVVIIFMCLLLSLVSIIIEHLCLYIFIFLAIYSVFFCIYLFCKTILFNPKWSNQMVKDKNRENEIITIVWFVVSVFILLQWKADEKKTHTESRINNTVAKSKEKKKKHTKENSNHKKKR